MLRAPPPPPPPAAPAPGSPSGGTPAPRAYAYAQQAPKRSARDKPSGALVLAVIFWVMTPVALLGAIISGIVFAIALDFYAPSDARFAFMLQTLPLVLLVQTILNVVGGIGLWNVKSYGRPIAIISCAFWLMWGLVWTAVAPLPLALLIILPNAAGLVYLLLPKTKLAFADLGRSG